MKSRVTQKRYQDMNLDELREATKKFDQPFVPTRRLSESGRAELRAAKIAAARRRGRPIIGSGARRILVSIEGDLLARADAYRKVHGMKRSQLVALGLQVILSKAS